MKLNVLTRLYLFFLSFLIVSARSYAQQDVETLFRRHYLDELIERDLEFDVELLERSYGELVNAQQYSKHPALKSHQELPPLPDFNPRKYKTTNALTPGTPPRSQSPDHSAEKQSGNQVERPATPPISPERQPPPLHSSGLLESDEHYISDKSSGSAGSTSSIVDRRKKPQRRGRYHVSSHGKREETELAAPLFLQAKLKNRDDELEDFFDYY